MMKVNGSMEMVSFEMTAGTSLEDALNGIRVLKDFYTNQAGFRNLQAAQEKDGRWTLVLHWNSPEAEKKASAAMMGSATTDEFKKMVIPHTVTKQMYRCYT